MRNSGERSSNLSRALFSATSLRADATSRSALRCTAVLPDTFIDRRHHRRRLLCYRCAEGGVEGCCEEAIAEKSNRGSGAPSKGVE